MTGAHDDVGIRLNDEQKLYVIPAGGGYSCFGYENCARDSRALADKLGRPDLMPGEAHFGTVEGYALYRELLGLASKRDLGTWFTPGTPKPVEDIIARHIGSDQRLRLTYGDQDTGRMWDDRPETGRIGRTGGIMKSPILCANRRSTGGDLISTDAIVKIELSPGGRVLWAHPNLHAAPDAPEADAPEAEAAPAP